MEAGPSLGVSGQSANSACNLANTNFLCLGPSTCQDVVANQPESFSTAFWEFGSFEIYQSA